jgi:hypothetical protein
LKIEKRRPRVLEFDEEIQRVPAARAAGIDRLSLDPPIPLKNDQAFCFLVLHSTRSARIGTVAAIDYETAFSSKKTTENITGERITPFRGARDTAGMRQKRLGKPDCASD